MKSNRFLSWAVGEVFFVFSVLEAVAFAILSDEIAGKLKLTESDLGLLSGVFFVTYAVSQLGFGILIGRVPARLVLGGTALLAAAGTFIFSLSDGLTAALIGRVMMGIGLSSTFVGVIYLVGRGYGKNFAFMSSLSQSLANMSAAGLAITSAFYPILADFRLPFEVLTGLFVLSAVLVFTLVGGQAPSATMEVKPPLSAAFKEALASGQFWAALVYYAGTFGTLLAFADLWDIQFQMNFFGHTVQQSAVMNSMIPLGVTVGGLAAGAWATKSGFVRPAQVFVLLVLGCFLTLLLFPLSLATAGALMFVIGCGFSSSTLGLTALQQHLSPQTTPLATSLVVTGACIFGGVVQPLVGAAIGAPVRSGELIALVQSANPDFGTYQRGIVWLLASVVFAVVASWFFRPAPVRG
ncbi:MAG: MFS transporter [Opitutales bacterium]|jgi:MFS family permease